MPEINDIKNVVDAYGNSYNVEKKIGEGSQGSTFLLQGGTHIVKLFNPSININPTALKSKINFLIQLDLDKNRYSTPLREITQPSSGYISEFASGMLPLSSLMLDSKPDDENQVEWFIRTGGLLKRYGVLIKLASEIRLLHAKGLIYCDLSDNNVFVSENHQKHNVFIIDLDNLRYRTGVIHNIYTPGYGAPEVVQGTRPNSPGSDEFSFAIIAYKLLTWAHPLIGDIVNEGEPELEEKAYRGELPWCENEKDNSNARTEYGLPSQMFVTKKIMKLFKQTFEVGLNEPFNRPSMGAWVDALNDSLNELLKCPDCGIHYPFKSIGHCPFCEKEAKDVLHLNIQRWDKDIQYDRDSNSIKEEFTLFDTVYEEILLDAHTPKLIKAYHLNVTTEDHAESGICSMKMSVDVNGDIVLEMTPLENCTFFYRFADSPLDKWGQFNTQKRIRISSSRSRKIVIGPQPFDQDQQVIVI